MEIIECLRQETCHIDGVGRCQEELVVEFLVHEGFLDETLTVVEHTFHLKSRYVLTESGELFLLDEAYLVLWIENGYIDAGHAQESVGYS